MRAIGDINQKKTLKSVSNEGYWLQKLEKNSE
jgi:hypothetical protein